MAENNKIIFGVCSWLANKFNFDTTVVRILFVMALFFLGTGIGLYFILWIVKVLEEKE